MNNVLCSLSILVFLIFFTMMVLYEQFAHKEKPKRKSELEYLNDLPADAFQQYGDDGERLPHTEKSERN